MGAQESKSNVPDTPETPHFAAYANLFTLTEDPRSPGGVLRTPLLLADPLTDPRSPATKDVDRTPIFAIPEPATPFVSYKLDNPAYEDSPLSTNSDSSIALQQDRIVEKLDEMRIVDEIQSVGHKEEEDPKFQSSGKQNIPEPCNKDRTRQRKRSKKNSNSKVKQSLLKTVLFKPYVDENDENKQPRTKETTPKRTPLASRNFVVFENENTSSTKKLEIGNIRNHENSEKDILKVKRKITLNELSMLQEKENIQF